MGPCRLGRAPSRPVFAKAVFSGKEAETEVGMQIESIKGGVGRRSGVLSGQNVVPLANDLRLSIPVAGTMVRLDIRLMRERVTLADLVPLAYEVCDAITETALEAHPRRWNVPCCKGCSACCSRCLVPISPPEAFYLAQCIRREPPSRRNMTELALLGAARRILKSAPPEIVLRPMSGDPTAGAGALLAVSRWYEGLKVACPFLHFGCCSMYEQRPLACRQYYVFGSAEGCSGRPGVAEPVGFPVSMVDVLVRLTAELEGTAPEAIILPLAPAWVAIEPARGCRTWPARTAVAAMIRIITEMAEASTASTALAS